MTCSSQPLVSVVTPVYNGEKYVAECIQSVLDQTYTHWEYIIVNNCSVDRSGEIARAFAAKDSRIHVFENNVHVSAAENHQIGFRQMSSTSKYCKVVHADDWIYPECLERMVEVAETHPSVGLVGAYQLDGIRVKLDGLPYPSVVVPGPEVCRLTLTHRGFYVFGSPTSLLMRSDAVRHRDPFYDESTYPCHWDTAVCYEVLQDSDFGFVHQVLTFTRKHPAARTSFSERMYTVPVENIRMFQQYGPVFFGRTEYADYLRQKIRRYYRLLGRSAFRLRDREFWDYHRSALRSLGTPSRPWRIVGMSLSAALEEVLSPVNALRKAFHFLWAARKAQ